jgi:CheY-like chemotaxis protein
MLSTGEIRDAQRPRAAQAIERNASALQQLVNDLLDVSRIVSGRLRLDVHSVVAADVVSAAIDAVRPAAVAKQIRVTTAIPDATLRLSADPDRLRQVIWNLLSNAVKFTPSEGEVVITLRKVGQVAEIHVSDSGEGIPPDFLPSVFEPFRQADASMSIVNHLVEAHGGTVRAESGGEGHGATFIVRLPIVPAVADLPGDGSAIDDGFDPPAAVLSGISVLVVDDDEENREVVAAHLEHERARVFTAASAAQAFDFLHRQHVDVLLADIAMPGEDGYSLIRKVRASSASTTASIPAVALTALAHEQDRQQALRSGFQLHLAKPVDARALVAAVASLGRGHPV